MDSYLGRALLVRTAIKDQEIVNLKDYVKQPGHYNFKGANLQKVNFDHANLQNANLQNSLHERASFTGANLINTYFFTDEIPKYPNEAPFEDTCFSDFEPLIYYTRNSPAETLKLLIDMEVKYRQHHWEAGSYANKFRFEAKPDAVTASAISLQSYLNNSPSVIDIIKYLHDRNKEENFMINVDIEQYIDFFLLWQGYNVSVSTFVKIVPHMSSYTPPPEHHFKPTKNKHPGSECFVQ